MITHLDLFSGIGGFSLAADLVWGKENVNHIFCEIEEFSQKVLRKHWPNSELHNDITKLDGTAINDVHLLTGGFPCQPYSVAGKQLGEKDDRALWPEMLRVISETKPCWIIGENVGGFVSMGLDDCLSDLEGEGYDCQPLVIPACAVEAKHRRDRVWILAQSTSVRLQGCCESRSSMGSSGEDGTTDKPSRADMSCECEDVADTKGIRKSGEGCVTVKSKRSREMHTITSDTPQVLEDANEQRGRLRTTRGKDAGNALEQPRTWKDENEWFAESGMGRVAHGIPGRVDRLKGLGNAIVPQVAQVIMQAIKEIDA